MPKLIDLKAERALAQDNVNDYRHVKHAAIEILNRYPKANHEFVIQALCEKNSIDMKDFNFVLEVENIMFKDFINGFKK